MIFLKIYIVINVIYCPFYKKKKKKLQKNHRHEIKFKYEFNT